MKVLVADKFEAAGLEGLKALGATVEYHPGLGTEKLPGAITEHAPEILVVRSTKVPAGVTAEAKGLRVIVRAGSGVDNIDVAAARSRGIKVCNCPGMNAVAVAELAFGLILACDRRIPDQCVAAREGKWNKKEFSKARGLKGTTLAVVGVGAIGQEVITRGVAFGMRVIAWSRSITEQHARALGCEFGGTDTPALHALAKQADVVSVHLPLADSTKHLFGTEFFGCMKPGAIFVNTSRGPIVDEAALRSAIQSKGIRAGLDVYEDQPSATEGAWSSATVKLPGVVSTHHCGASTDQAQMAVALEVVRIVRIFKESGRVEHEVGG
ncbi:MAG: NAD(P)-dependent oxidoreductase [Phycisphaerales bacterium]